jgi:hypothetical protein
MVCRKRFSAHPCSSLGNFLSELVAEAIDDESFNPFYGDITTGIDGGAVGAAEPVDALRHTLRSNKDAGLYRGVQSGVESGRAGRASTPIYTEDKTRGKQLTCRMCKSMSAFHCSECGTPCPICSNCIDGHRTCVAEGRWNLHSMTELG